MSTRRVLLLPHLNVHNANALSSPFTIGFPAMTAWLGFAHALERKLKLSGYPTLELVATGVFSHRCDLQTYRGPGDFVHSIVGTANPLDRDGNRSAFIEEARCHLDVSLLIEYRAHDNDLERIEQPEFIEQVEQLLIPMKVAGGDLLHDSGPVTLLAFHASPPVFDGPEDRNGRRNHDQLRFWQHYMDGVFGAAPKSRFVLLGHANQDPNRSEGIKAGIRGLLSDPRIQDVVPLRPDGNPPEATVNWPRVTPPMMRVGYVLPSRGWTVEAAGIYWPVDGDAAKIAGAASRHRIVWVDLVVD